MSPGTKSRQMNVCAIKQEQGICVTDDVGYESRNDTI